MGNHTSGDWELKEDNRNSWIRHSNSKTETEIHQQRRDWARETNRGGHPHMMAGSWWKDPGFTWVWPELWPSAMYMYKDLFAWNGLDNGQNVCEKSEKIKESCWLVISRGSTQLWNDELSMVNGRIEKNSGRKSDVGRNLKTKSECRKFIYFHPHGRDWQDLARGRCHLSVRGVHQCLSLFLGMTSLVKATSYIRQYTRHHVKFRVFISGHWSS